MGRLYDLLRGSALRPGRMSSLSADDWMQIVSIDWFIHLLLICDCAVLIGFLARANSPCSVQWSAFIVSVACVTGSRLDRRPRVPIQRTRMRAETTVSVRSADTIGTGSLRWRACSCSRTRNGEDSGFRETPLIYIVVLFYRYSLCHSPLHNRYVKYFISVTHQPILSSRPHLSYSRVFFCF